MGDYEVREDLHRESKSQIIHLVYNYINYTFIDFGMFYLLHDFRKNCKTERRKYQQH